MVLCGVIALLGGLMATFSGLLSAIGFSSAGIVVGSIAAGIQAFFGNIGVGSIFALLQSFAASGFSFIFGIVGVGISVLGGILSYLF